MSLKSIFIVVLFALSSCATTKYGDNADKNNFSNLQTGKKVDLEQQKLYKRLKYSQINWGTAYFLADSPDKTLAQAQGKQLIFNQIAEKMGEPKYALDLISAYFVPTQSGTEYISALPIIIDFV